MIAFAASASGRARFLTVVFGLCFAIVVPTIDAGARRGHQIGWSPYSRLQLYGNTDGKVVYGEALAANRSWYQFLLDLTDDMRARYELVDRHRIAHGFCYDATGTVLQGKRVAVAAPARGTTSPRWVYLFFGPGLDRDALRARLAALGCPDQADERLAMNVSPTTDDWPFLYLNPQATPTTYLWAVAGLVLATCGAIALAAPRGPSETRRFVPSRLDVEVVLLGIAFMILETKGIAELARLFGATWIVTGIVLTGIFAVLVVANALATRVPPRAAPWFGVAAAVALLVPRAIDLDLNELAPWPRAIAAGLLVGLPVGFAGLSFSRAFAGVAPGDAGRALGLNLAGAAVGGGVESLTLFFGLGVLTWIAAGLYVAWAAVHASRVRPAPAVPPLRESGS